MAETKIEYKSLLSVQHPRCVKFELAAPAMVVRFFEIRHFGFGERIKHFSTEFEIPPREQRTVVRGIQTGLVGIEAILRKGVLASVGIESCYIADGIMVV